MSDRAFVLTRLLERCEVLSLDVFDTALLRRIDEPVDAFELVGKQYAALQPSVEPFAFADSRRAAERAARERVRREHGRGDVLLDEIYQSLVVPEGWSVPALLELELATERLLCVANPFVHALYTRALELGKRVVFVSDMYLPQAFIGELLDAAGYRKREALLVSSSEGGQTKGQGGLYRLLVERLAVSPAAIFHIGDNKVSDVQMARAAGLRAELYERCAERGRRQRRHHPSRNPSAAIYRGLVHNRLHAERGLRSRLGFWYRLGYEMLGPLWHHYRGDRDAIASALGASATILSVLALAASPADERARELRAGRDDLASDRAPLEQAFPWLESEAAVALAPFERMQRWPSAEEMTHLAALHPACASELGDTRISLRRIIARPWP